MAGPRPFTIDPDRDPWDRQINESGPAWQAFENYRDQGLQDGARRSIRRTAAALDKSRQLIGLWSSDHDWQRRTAAYDRHLGAIRLKAAADRIAKAARRHGDHIEALTMALIQPVQAYLTRIAHERSIGSDPFEGWTTRELAKAAAESARLMPNLVQAERLVYGLSTDKTEVVDERAAATKRWGEAGRGELETFLLGAEAGRQFADTDQEQEPVGGQ